jgi:hypothetical protein
MIVGHQQQAGAIPSPVGFNAEVIERLCAVHLSHVGTIASADEARTICELKQRLPREARYRNCAKLGKTTSANTARAMAICSVTG